MEDTSPTLPSFQHMFSAAATVLRLNRSTVAIHMYTLHQKKQSRVCFIN